MTPLYISTALNSVISNNNKKQVKQVAAAKNKLLVDTTK